MTGRFGSRRLSRRLRRPAGLLTIAKNDFDQERPAISYKSSRPEVQSAKPPCRWLARVSTRAAFFTTNTSTARSSTDGRKPNETISPSFSAGRPDDASLLKHAFGTLPHLGLVPIFMLIEKMAVQFQTAVLFKCGAFRVRGRSRR